VTLVLLLAACTSGAAQRETPFGSPSVQPSASSASPSAAPTQSLPDGVYSTTITRADTDASGDGHIVNLGSLLIGRYRLMAREGAFSVSLEGQTTVPRPSPRRTGGEGAYARYGFWIFLGVPPIGDGRYTGSSSRVVFRSERGACFQNGATATLTTGTYRWSLRGRELTLSARAPGQGPSADGCLGRRFVFTAHPWVKET
jgi:hypothetical protein